MNLFTFLYLFLFFFYNLFAWTFYENTEIIHRFGDISKTANLNPTISSIELLLFSFHLFFLIFGLISILFYFLNFKRIPWLFLDLGIFSILYGICSLLSNPLVKYFIPNSSTTLLIFILSVNIVYLPLINGFLRLKDFKGNRILIKLFQLNTGISLINITLIFGFNTNPEAQIVVNIFALITLVLHKLNIIIPLIISIRNQTKGLNSSGTIFSLTLTLVFMFVEILLKEYSGVNNLPLTSFGIIFCLIGLMYSLGKKYYLDFERSKQIEQNFSEMKYHLLLAQMNPHFLYNALNTIHSFLENNSPDASKAIIHLANLYRMGQKLLNETQNTISTEITFIKQYLEFQKLRFPKRLKIKFRTDLELNEKILPSFILQPIVENSINHGYMQSNPRIFVITLTTKKIDDRHGIIEISDNGLGITPDILKDEALLYSRSLGNIKRRLELSSPSNELVILSSKAGTTIKILFEI